ncbi:hypothetical protein NF27_DT01430 [Candidatus Jidaibacter acanthamoeba]|uniref:Uncharacterized protein n=1 Tax=Candidatus Jidaibacter acanthamoebae TaxID=86105 RepID=A0A0C1QIM7_9RICK|nr:hypothetical protein [Candidatus Jidaibacter acanthamoeba]KIE05369.1 hypothetical protein NF27_DT01430 [Candidatus Jidaibacter acanthamoeba]
MKSGRESSKSLLPKLMSTGEKQKFIDCFDFLSQDNYKFYDSNDEEISNTDELIKSIIPKLSYFKDVEELLLQILEIKSKEDECIELFTDHSIKVEEYNDQNNFLLNDSIFTASQNTTDEYSEQHIYSISIIFGDNAGYHISSMI